MPVQWVNRPDLDFRGFAGQIVGGTVRPGDPVRVLPSGKDSTVARIVTYDGDLDEAVAGQSVTLTLTDEIDISRGDVIAAAAAPAGVADQFAAHVVWMARAADASRPALPAQDRRPDRRCDGGAAQVQGERQHARAHGGQDARAQRDRRVQPQPRPADPVRSLRDEPRHGRVHPHRPLHQRDRRRRHVALRAPARRQRALAGDRGRQGRARGDEGPAALRRVVHRAVRRPASRPSPTSSSASCTSSVGTRTCSTATTYATASTRTSASPMPTASRTSAASPRSPG